MERLDDVEALETRLFLEAINLRYGYDLRGYAEPSINRRLRAALARSGCAHLGELQHRVLTDTVLFAQVLEDLTVQVSQIFRDPTFYKAFREQVIPVLRTYPLLRIWHAGCARGEEVHASAILLLEAGLYDRAQIYATDLSVGALEQAKQGIYSEDSLAAFTRNYEQSGGTGRFADYYTAAYGGFVLRESLRRNVLFFQHNLVSDQAFGEMHVVFCRNVLIYFGGELRSRVLHKITQSVAPGGFLCLGASESLSGAGEKLPYSDFVAAERIYRHET
jgi:chemotaxis protein methyltransferase CheR